MADQKVEPGVQRRAYASAYGANDRHLMLGELTKLSDEQMTKRLRSMGMAP